MLCRRLASLNQEFISYNSPSAGFDFTSGRRIEQKLLDYNQEAERFGGNGVVLCCEKGKKMNEKRNLDCDFYFVYLFGC